jgi:hypothetical protein
MTLDELNAVALTKEEIADAVWDEATSGHVASGSFGRLVGTTWAAVFSGITSLLKIIQAIVRSDTPDATALGEINSGGGTFSSGAHSLKAQADLVAVRGTVHSSPAPTTAAIATQSGTHTIGHYNLSAVVFISGSMAGLVRKINGHTVPAGGVSLYTFDRELPAAPSSGDSFIVMAYVR